MFLQSIVGFGISNVLEAIIFYPFYYRSVLFVLHLRSLSEIVLSFYMCMCTYVWFWSLWQTSIASPFTAQQQQMAALLAQQQQMIMAAAAAKNMQAAAFMQGQNQASGSENSGVASLQGSSFGQQGSAFADLQPLGSLVSKPGVQNGVLSFSQVE